jgi:hypothetical protein
LKHHKARCVFNRHALAQAGHIARLESTHKLAKEGAPDRLGSKNLPPLGVDERLGE